MAYIGKAPGFGIRNRYYYTASSSQTLFSGADDNGQTLAYADSKYLDVYLNGVLLVAGTDYTATTLTSVTLSSGAAASDIIEIVAYDIFSVADTVSAANGGTFSGAITVDADGATVATFDRATSDGTIAEFQKDGSTVGSIGASGGDVTFYGDVGIKFSGDDVRPINSSGANADDAVDLGHFDVRWQDLYLSGGVYLGGTGAANYFDDYEEGTWTPAFQNLGSGSVSYSTRNGYYRKMGDLVYAFFSIQNSTVSGTSNEAVEINVPFTPNIFSTREIASGSAASYLNDWPQNGTLVTRLESGGLRFMVAADNVTWQNVTYENSSGIYWEGHIWYRTNA